MDDTSKVICSNLMKKRIFKSTEHFLMTGIDMSIS